MSLCRPETLEWLGLRQISASKDRRRAVARWCLGHPMKGLSSADLCRGSGSESVTSLES